MRSAAAGAVRTPSRGGFVRRGLKLGHLVHRMSCLKVASSACDTEPAPSLSLPVVVVHVEPPTKPFPFFGGGDAAGRREDGTNHRRTGTARKRRGGTVRKWNIIQTRRDGTETEWKTMTAKRRR